MTDGSIHCKNQRLNPTASQCMEHYGCIYENNHLVTLLVDPERGKIIDANRAACTFYGYTLQELRKLCIHSLNGDPDAADFVRKASPTPADKGQNRVFRELHTLASGQMTNVEIHTGLIEMLGRTCIYSVVHDINERVEAEERLKESEERYRGLVELFPEAILVYRSGVILFANNEAEQLLGSPKEALVGRSLDSFLHDSFRSSGEYVSYKLMEQAKMNFRKELRIIRKDGFSLDLEITGAPITYKGAGAIQLVLRDVTESKKEIKRAVRLQEHRQAEAFPLPGKADLKKLYVPAGTLSGDFYIFHKINEEEVIGIIGDVTGKGITAALNISAMRVLFAESARMFRNPVEVLRDLNRRVMLHMDEDYIAACCFHLDFGTGRLTAAGAGINEFIYIPAGQEAKRQVVKGAPIGMFGDSVFEEETIFFKPGDSFIFYSDGVELLQEEDALISDYDDLESRIRHTALQDDCTWLSLKMN